MFNKVNVIDSMGTQNFKLVSEDERVFMDKLRQKLDSALKNRKQGP